MWSSLLNTSRGGYSARRILTFALTIFSVAFAWVLIFSSPTFAATNWESESVINHNGDNYYGPASEHSVEKLGLDKGTTAFNFIEDTSKSPRHVHVIYFEPTVDSSVATGAKYKTYIYQGPDNYTNPSSVQDITITPLSSGTSGSLSSCDVDHGIGWLICPVTNFLASSMDWFFGILTGFLEVRPVETGNTETALYRAWSYMRAIANIAFVIVFLILIYSQMTGFGLSNYSIKSLLPRLIIAALLVNVSFLVSAIAIDLSNILGYSIQNLFIDMRNGLVGAEGNTWDIISWESIGGFILSGGLLVGAGTAGLVATISTYGVGGAVMFLLVGLVIALVSVLVALLVLAARQAIITILVILSPLAFVAYLLPNTEKWFEKWRSLFTTMLILFPAFSVIFGGSQLAASIILQNADSINLIILGLLVQVAPLIITPMLVKLSGSLVGKIAGLINNPNKGIIDRTRNYVKDQTDGIAARRLGTAARPYQIFKRNAQRVDANRRRREGWKATYTNMAEARWTNSHAFSDMDQINREASERKSLGETNSELRYADSKVTNPGIRTLDTDLRHAKARLENSNLQASITNWEENHSADVAYTRLRTRVLKDRETELHSDHDAHYNIQKTLRYQQTAEYNRLSPASRMLVQQAQFSAERIAVYGMASQTAKNVQQHDLAVRLEQSQQLREEAGASIIDPNGAQRALASATTTIKRVREETIGNTKTIIERGNLSADSLLELALGSSQVGSNGVRIEATDDTIEAAIGMVIDSGNVGSMIRLSDRIDLSAAANEDHRLAFTDALKRASGRPKFFGAGWMGLVNQGIPGGVGQLGIDDAIRNTINDEKFSSEVLVTQDKDALERVGQAIRRHGIGYFDTSALANLKRQIVGAYLNESYSGRVAERNRELRGIMSILDGGGITYPQEATERPRTSL